MKRAAIIGFCAIVVTANLTGNAFSQNVNARQIHLANSQISGDSLTGLLRHGYDIYLDSCVVTSDVLMGDNPAIIAGEIKWQNCRFPRILYLSNCTFAKEVNILSCQFDRRVDIANARFLERVSFKCNHFSASSFILTLFNKGVNFEDVSFDAFADFSNAIFTNSDIAIFGFSSSFANAKFKGNMVYTYESGIYVRVVNVSASFVNTYLSDVSFDGALMKGVIFEPAQISDKTKSTLARAMGLDRLLFAGDSRPLSDLRRYFKENLYDQAEKKVMCAIKRHNQTWFERILFDIPFEYGSNLWLPIKIVLLQIPLFAVIYFAFISADREKSGVNIIRDGITNYELPSGSRFIIEGTRRKKISVWKRAGIGLMLSLLATTNIGFREYDFGRLIGLLFRSKTSYEPFGWVRTLAGVQSIFSVLFIAMIILSYFGHPFE